MGLNGTIVSPIPLRATLSAPQPNVYHVISGIKVNLEEVSVPDEDGVIQIWVTPNAIVPDTELSGSSTNVLTNKAITDYLTLSSEQKQALADLLD